MKLDQTIITEAGNAILEEKKETPLVFLQRVIPEFVKNLLTQDKGFWKEFGMYWYNLQDVIKHYATREYRQYADYVGGEDVFGGDDEIKKQYDEGSDFNNWIAAQYYLEMRSAGMGIGLAAHQHEDEEGNIFSYETGAGIIQPERE